MIDFNEASEEDKVRNAKTTIECHYGIDLATGDDWTMICKVKNGKYEFTELKGAKNWS